MNLIYTYPQSNRNTYTSKRWHDDQLRNAYYNKYTSPYY